MTPAGRQDNKRIERREAGERDGYRCFAPSPIAKEHPVFRRAATPCQRHKRLRKQRMMRMCYPKPLRIIALIRRSK